MSFQCYQIGGPFISFDPDCPAHGYEAQAREAEREREEQEAQDTIARLQAEVDAWRVRFPQYVYRPQDEVVALRKED